MYAKRTLPVFTYSLKKVVYVSSCHCLQYGHWKSLTMMTHVLAAGFPVIRDRSARTRSESLAWVVEAAVVEGAGIEVAAVLSEPRVELLAGAHAASRAKKAIVLERGIGVSRQNS